MSVRVLIRAYMYAGDDSSVTPAPVNRPSLHCFRRRGFRPSRVRNLQDHRPQAALADGKKTLSLDPVKHRYRVPIAVTITIAMRSQ